MDNIVELKNVSKVYKTGEREFYALRDVDLDIERGKLVVILGPSGAGKTTLLNLIGGLDNPSVGTVTVDGEDIAGYNENELSDYRAGNVGFIFQFYNILPSLTVKENVDLVRDVTETDITSEEALEGVGLAEHMQKFPGQLSGGEQQRVSIARAVAKAPKLMLCDEPTGALDSETGIGILKLLKSRTSSENGNGTVIIVTHNTLMAEVADVVIRVKNGRITDITENQNPKPIDEVTW